MTSPFDRPGPDVQNPAWQPMIEGMHVLAAAIEALVTLCQHLAELMEQLRKMLVTSRE